jgi:tRNA1(Val) A37 N6-methylase TrmN6
MEDYDFYNSDPQTINDLLAKMPQLGYEDLNVLEPCAGLGVLGDRYASLTGNRVTMVDIKARRQDIIEANYMDYDAYNRFDLIITNFPYKEATSDNPRGFSELLNKAFNDVKLNGYVCSLQRLTHLESKKRYEKIYGRRPPQQVFIYSHRLKCFKDKSLVNTTVPYCWAVWHKDENGFFTKETKLDWIY